MGLTRVSYNAMGPAFIRRKLAPNGAAPKQGNKKECMENLNLNPSLNLKECRRCGTLLRQEWAFEVFPQRLPNPGFRSISWVLGDLNVTYLEALILRMGITGILYYKKNPAK